MSTLHVVKLGGVAVHKDGAVSTGAFSLNGQDSSYLMSAKKVVFKVPTLGRKSTNMQLTDFYNLFAQISNPVLLFEHLHDRPLQAVTCHYFIEVFIIISQVISHCICSIYHILTCSGTYVMFICTSYHPPSDTGAINA